MGKLEERVYTKSVLDESYLKVTNHNAKFIIHNYKDEEFELQEFIDRKDLNLENYPHLLQFFSEMQFMKLGYDIDKRAFYASLNLKKIVKNKEKNENLYYKNGANFSIIFEDLENYLRIESDFKKVNLEQIVYQASQQNMYLQVFGGNRLCGIVYDNKDGRSVFVSEIEASNLDLQNFPYINEHLTAGKNLSLSFLDTQIFQASIFYRKRKINGYGVPYDKINLEKGNGFCILDCLKELEYNLEKKTIFSTRIRSHN